jgi:hypothetical protein
MNFVLYKLQTLRVGSQEEFISAHDITLNRKRKWRARNLSLLSCLWERKCYKISVLRICLPPPLFQPLNQETNFSENCVSTLWVSKPIDVSEWHRPYLQCRRVIQVRSQHEADRKQSSNCCLVYADFLLGLLFNPEDGHDIFLRNVDWLPPDCTPWNSRGQKSSYPYLSMAPQSSVGPWPLFQFLNPMHSRQDSLNGRSARHKAATYIENNINIE